MEDLLGSDAVAEYKERNIFPVAYNVTLTDLSVNYEVQNEIKQIPQVDDIVSSNQLIAQILRLAKGVKYVTAAILALLIVISISIISNTIKLTVHARRKEISIMKYVGATNSFIRWPFIVEGIIIGIISALLTILIIYGGYTVVVTKILNVFNSINVTVSLLTFADMYKIILVVYMVLGIGIGAIGSGISMRKYLEV